MIRFAADEDLNRDILRGLLRRRPDLDIVGVTEEGLGGIEDPAVLQWAASAERVLLSHDVTTLTEFAYERVAAGSPMPGVFQGPQDAPTGRVIDDLVLIAECSCEGEWEGQVRYLPLR